MNGFLNALHICCVLFSTVDMAVGVEGGGGGGGGRRGLGGSSKSLISILVPTTYSFPLAASLMSECSCWSGE